MHLVLVAVLIAACGADKLDRTYLPPASANTAGGSPGALQTPFRTFNQGLGSFPKGGYSNDFEGVVVEAVAPGSRASGSEETGLGGPRIAYGSTDSKVGEAAFTADTAFPRVGVQSSLSAGGISGGPSAGGTFGTAQNTNKASGTFSSPGGSFGTGLHPGGTSGAGSSSQAEFRPERIQASRDRASNTVKYESDVSADSFKYAFETDNGIVAEENGIEVNGVKAQGGYSYTGDDGQVYSVTYTADEGGYRPVGDHLPTPPPIPAEILESLEKNARDEAAGVVDDGSYDAQKYNTGQDYSNSNNDYEKYNGERPIQLGSRPQSDPEVSNSFISQNNQNAVRPNSNQFGFNPSLGSSNGNKYEVTGSADKTIQNKQTLGFGTFNQNTPTLNTGSQGNLQNGFLTSSGAKGVKDNQHSQPSTFVPLSQQKLQEDRPIRPQTGSQIFGKPTIIDSTLSIKDPFASRPIGNRFTQTQKPYQKPQQIGGSFEVVSGNVYSSKNEYLPPRRQYNKPNQNKGNQGFQLTSTGSQVNRQPIGSNLPSAFASVSRPSINFQSSQQNSQQIPQNPGNVLSSQLSETVNTNPLNKDKKPVSSSFSSTSGFNRSPVSQGSYKPSTFTSQFPTVQPQTELTTPLESNSEQPKDSLPVPVIDGPDSPSSSNLPSFSSQQSNSFISPNGFTNNKINKISPTQSAFTTLSDRKNEQGDKNTFEPGNFGGNIRPQVSNDEQYASSTQSPTYSQYNQQQGPDDSYYYNAPSRPFNIPTYSPHASKFSSSFDQSTKVTQTAFSTRPQLSDVPEFSSTLQSYKPNDNNRYSTLESVSPTSPTNQNSNAFQTQFNRVTQASASSFPSSVPTGPTDLQNNKFVQNPFSRPQQNDLQLNKGSQGLNLSNQPGSSRGSQSSQQTQKYNGEIYEYKRPTQTFPAPQNSASSGELGKLPQLGSSLTKPQPSPSQNSGTFKPFSQSDSQITQQQTFGQSPQNSQILQDNQALNLNNQIQSQTQFGSKPGYFGSQAFQGNKDFNTNHQMQGQSQSVARPGQFSFQDYQGNQAFNINGQVPNKPQSEARPGQFGSQASQGNQHSGNNNPAQNQAQFESRPGQFGPTAPQKSQAFNTQLQSQLPTKLRPGQFGFVPSKASQNSQSIQGASKFPPTYNDNIKTPCCKQVGTGQGQSSQADEQTVSQTGADQNIDQKDPTDATKPPEAVSSFTGVGESFGGPRKPPSFDKNGYHY